MCLHVIQIQHNTIKVIEINHLRWFQPYFSHIPAGMFLSSVPELTSLSESYSQLPRMVQTLKTILHNPYPFHIKLNEQIYIN